MNRLQILTAAKAALATGSGQPDKHLAICFAIEAVTAGKRGATRTNAAEIQNEIMAYLAPHLTFRQKLQASTAEVQAARHSYLQGLIDKEAS